MATASMHRIYLKSGRMVSKTCEQKDRNRDRHTHTHPFNGPLSGTTRVSQYRKVKPIWILLKQDTVSGSGISWAICKSAPCSRQTTMPAPHHSVFYRPDSILLPNQQRLSTEGKSHYLKNLQLDSKP